MKPHLSQAYIPISADQGQYMYQGCESNFSGGC
jgi:hypothetical protein